MACNYRRVFLCGVHSVGKTTLLRQLSLMLDTESFLPPGMPVRYESEVARSVLVEMGLQKRDLNPQTRPDTFEELQNQILLKQRAVEERNNRSGSCFCFLDRGIDPLVYARFYLGEEAYRRLLAKPHAQENVALCRDESSLVFVISPKPECIEHDGTRITPVLKEMNDFTDVMIRTLDEMKIRFVLIDVLDLTERVKIVEHAIRS